jgi:hypothetical protein
MKGDRQIQVLICSANLGNAQPDEASLHAWVPESGKIVPVLQNEKYPIRTNLEYDDSELHMNSHPDAEDYYEEYDQFDIIVFGLQESTFDPPSKADTSVHNLNNNQNNNNTNTNTNHPTALGNIQEEKNVSERTISTIITKSKDQLFASPTKVVTKASSALQTFTANRDYTRKFSESDIHHSSHHPLLLPNPEDRSWMGGTHVLHAMIDQRLFNYERIVSYQRGEMRLIVMAHPRLEVTVLHQSAKNTGRGGLANKGGIVTELLVHGHTRISFVTAHLEAHEGIEKYKQRVATIADIFAGTKESMHDCSLTAHYSFVMGDLNFRTELSRHENMGEEEHKVRVREIVDNKDWDALNHADELFRALHSKECLVGYQTLFCNFPPTFKVERRAGYQYIEKRRPSYTDRILYKAGHKLQNNIRPFLYEPIDDFTTSDHKPIRAAFAIDLNQPLSFRPKMARRRSVMSLTAMIKQKNRGSNQVVAHKERFHLFVSNMRAEIYTDGSKIGSSAPNPYVCLVSTPPEALRQEAKKGWGKFRARVRKAFHISSGSAIDTVYVTESGWPRSSIQKQTHVANWEEEEIHSEVHTHGPDGAPYDLTGAMLRITVMDRKVSLEDVVIGTCCLNLVDLIRSCQPSTRESSQRIIQSRSIKREKSSGRIRGGNIISHAFRSMSMTFRADANDPSETDPITTMDVDEPLLKNCVETGRIQCTVEAWWMDEATARAVGGSMLSPFPADHKRLANGGTSSKGSMLATRKLPSTLSQGLNKRSSDRSAAYEPDENYEAG